MEITCPTTLLLLISGPPRTGSLSIDTTWRPCARNLHHASPWFVDWRVLARATTLRITTLALVYSTAEYCAPVWSRNAHVHLLDRINDALRMLTGCLKPTAPGYLPALPGIPPAELLRKAATLSLSRQSLESRHKLHNYFNRRAKKRRLKSRKLFVIETQGLLAQNTNAPTWYHNTWKENWPKPSHVFTLSLPM